MGDLDKLGEKIREAEQHSHPPEKPPSPIVQGYNDGMQAATEFLSYAIGGGVLGFIIDRYAGTAPWGMIALCLAGFVMGVYRANQAMNKSSKKR
jgi:F0F1-type ATP synthase assembly protein I